MILLSVSLVALAIIYSLYAQQVELSSNMQASFLARSALQKIVTSANTVSISGPGSEVKIEIEFPNGIDYSNSGFVGRTIHLRLPDGSDVVGVAEVDFSGELRDIGGKHLIYLYYDGNSVLVHYNDFSLGKQSISLTTIQGATLEDSFSVRNNSSSNIEFWIEPDFSHSQVLMNIDSSNLHFTLAPLEMKRIDLNLVVSPSAAGNYSGSVNVIGEINDHNFSRRIKVSVESLLEMRDVMIYPKTTSFTTEPNVSVSKPLSLCNSSDEVASISLWAKDGNIANWFSLPSFTSVNPKDCIDFDLNFTIPANLARQSLDANMTFTYNDGNTFTSYFFVTIN
jgi:hypothetical protein